MTRTQVPALSPLSDDGFLVAGPPVATPPPTFRPIVGEPHHIQIFPTDYSRLFGDTAAKHAGLLYEAKVQEKLLRLFPNYMASPRISFFETGARRFVVPDGLLKLEDRGVVFEIKIRSMPEAWWQTERLYAPLVKNLWKIPVQTVLIVKSYDPACRMPGATTLVSDLEAWIKSPESLLQFGVFEWKL